MIIKRISIAILISIALVFLGRYLVQKKDGSASGNLYSHLGGEFTLQGIDGARNLKSFEGKSVVLYFGFTHCPDICPTAMSTLRKMFDGLAPEHREKLTPVFVSVDHKRDTPEIVDEYIKFYLPEGVGLSGDKSQIDKIVKSYGAYYKIQELKESAMGFTVDHSSRFYFINGKGELVGTILDSEPLENITKQMKSDLHL